MLPFAQLADDYRDKKILIMGLGLLGSSLGDALLFAELGCELRLTDLKTAAQLAPTLAKLKDIRADCILGEHRREDVEWADVIVRGAAVPWHHPLLELARSLHKPVVMDVQLFARYAGDITTIGITGTRGKTTTTHLINEIVKTLPEAQVLLGGNVKDVATLPLLKQLTGSRKTYAVLELSSWQLQAFHETRLSPPVAVLTNLYPDHMNAYQSLEAYYADKQAIYAYQRPGDAVFFNRHVPEFIPWAAAAPGRVLWYGGEDLPGDLTLALKGDHNRHNAAAAYKVGTYLGVPDADIRRVLAQFQALPHRLQPVKVVNGVTYINDTTSTTPVAAITALRTIPAPIVLILGGSDKNLPVAELAEAVNAGAAQVVLLTGNGTDRIKPLLDSHKIVTETGSLEAAVSAAARVAAPGSSVLLSPGFTSFGLFHNEYHRGDEFIRLVNRLS